MTSLLNHKCRSPLLPSVKTRRISLVLHAYFDESGKFQDSHFICLAGYIADDARWEVFCQEWAELLLKHHIPYVHMKNMIALQGEYKDLGWTYEHRDIVLKDFIGVIRRNVLAAFAIGLDAKHYRKMPLEARKRLGNDPFLFSFVRLIKRVTDTLTKNGIGHGIIMVFDDDKDYAMRCYSLWCELKKRNPQLGKQIGAMCYADDTIFQALQGADILAHQTNKFMRDCVEGRNPRPLFHELIQSPVPGRSIEYITEIWDGDGLDNKAGELRDSSWIADQ